MRAVLSIATFMALTVSTVIADGIFTSGGKTCRRKNAWTDSSSTTSTTMSTTTPIITTSITTTTASTTASTTSSAASTTTSEPPCRNVAYANLNNIKYRIDCDYEYIVAINNIGFVDNVASYQDCADLCGGDTYPSCSVFNYYQADVKGSTFGDQPAKRCRLLDSAIFNGGDKVGVIGGLKTGQS